MTDAGVLALASAPTQKSRNVKDCNIVTRIVVIMCIAYIQSNQASHLAFYTFYR
jgi:hypothetical protein